MLGDMVSVKARLIVDFSEFEARLIIFLQG
jgi:hypothetical protein